MQQLGHLGSARVRHPENYCNRDEHSRYSLVCRTTHFSFVANSLQAQLERLRAGETKCARSFFADDLLDVSQEGVAIHHCVLRIVENPFFADHALRVDEKKRPDRAHDLFIEDSITPDDFSFDEVAEQRVR